MAQVARRAQGREKPVYQVVPLTTTGGGWVRDLMEMRWQKTTKKLKQNPGCLIKIRRQRKNEQGFFEDRPIDYFIKNGQTTDMNNATADGCTPDQVYDALYEHSELGKRFKLVEYTETQAEIERRAQRIRSVVSLRDQQTQLNGSEGLAEGREDSKFQNPQTAMANQSEQDMNQQMNVAGISQLQPPPVITSDGMVAEPVGAFNE
jgi:hypothetical protein